MHGANRLASNSLLEALVFGARVAESALATTPDGPVPTPDPLPAAGDPRLAAPEIRHAVRALAWQRLGLVRDGAGLAAASESLANLWRALPSGASEARSLVAAGTLVAAAAARREESRGAHYRTDFPAPSDAGAAGRSSRSTPAKT